MPVPSTENGGFYASSLFLFVPVQAFSGAIYVGVYNYANFNDPNDGSSYSYRQEDIAVGRVPTVRRVVLVYRDLGIAKITIQLSGVNDNGQLVTASAPFTIGTAAASTNNLTLLADVTLTAYRPQLTISRAANAGPVSIISATIVGEVEQVTL